MRRTLAAVGMALAFAVLPAPARADDKAACADAYEGAQRHRTEGKLSLARAELEVCARSCVDKLAEDCQRWAAEVDALLAHVKVDARDARGQPVERVTLSADGRTVSRDAGAGTVALDPGEHLLELVTESGARVSLRVSLRPGESRTVEPRFPAQGPPPVPSGSVAPGPVPLPPPAAPSPSTGRTPVLAYVFGGTGLALLAGGAALGIAGHLEATHLRSTCHHDCTDAQVQPITTEWVIGGVVAGVGALSFGTGVVLFATRPKVGSAEAAEQRALRLDLTPAADGLTARASLRF